MSDFNAEKARELVRKTHIPLAEILDLIKSKAEQGEEAISIARCISDSTLDQLGKLGFGFVKETVGDGKGQEVFLSAVISW